MESNLTRDEIIEEINRIQEKTGRYPGRSEFKEHSKFSKDDVLRHFEWYGEAIKAARSATSNTARGSNGTEGQPTESAPNRLFPGDDSSVGRREEKQFKQESDGSRERGVRKTNPEDEAGASQPESTKQNTKTGETNNSNHRSIVVRITDEGIPLSGAEVTVDNPNASGGRTDEHGDVEINIPEDLDQVSVRIAHHRWADKALDALSGSDGTSRLLDVPQSEWETDTADANTSSNSENRDNASEAVSTILKDLDQLDQN